MAQQRNIYFSYETRQLSQFSIQKFLLNFIIQIIINLIITDSRSLLVPSFDPKRLELYKRLECCIVFSLVFQEKQVLLFQEPILQVLIVRSPGMLSLRQCPLCERTRNHILPFVDRERSRFTRTNSAILPRRKMHRGNVLETTTLTPCISIHPTWIVSRWFIVYS